jgi:hypothetical protein
MKQSIERARMALRRLSNRFDVQGIVVQDVGDLIRSFAGLCLLMVQYLLGDDANWIEDFGATSHHQASEGGLQASRSPLLTIPDVGIE